MNMPVPLPTPLRPVDPVWDTAWIPASPGWLESVDDEDAWVINHPAGVDVGDMAMCWSASLSDLRSRIELVNPEDGYCRQCLGIAPSVRLVKCRSCGHDTHLICAQPHSAAHAEANNGGPR